MKKYTNKEILDTLPNGSVIQFDHEKGRWIKAGHNWYHSTDISNDMYDTGNYENFTLTVKYWGDL